MKTLCRKCCFATWDGNKQIGCSFNDRVAKFVERGEAELVSDEEQEFYQIDRYCNACIIADTPKEEVEEFIKTSVDYILVLGKEEKESQLYERVLEIIGSDEYPKQLYIIVNNGDSVKDLYIKYFTILKEYGINVLVTHPIIKFDDNMCFNIVANKCKSQYITIFGCSDVIPCNLIDMLDEKINYEMEKIIAIKPVSDFHGAVLSKQMVRLYRNDLDVATIIEDIEKNNPELVQKWK